MGLLHGSQKFYKTKANLWTCHEDPVNPQTEVDQFLNEQKPPSLGKRQREQITRRFKQEFDSGEPLAQRLKTGSDLNALIQELGSERVSGIL